MLAGRLECRTLAPLARDASASSHRHADVLAGTARRTVSRCHGGVKSIVLSAHRQTAAAAERLDAGDDQALGQVHHGAVVAVGLVQLHHGEFGIVPRADALVAEDPADLVDLLDAADQQPLQVQLQGDAQEQIDVERVVVRDERPGRGAAGDGVQRRRLDLAEAPVVEVAADGADDQDALAGRGRASPGCRSDRDSGAAADTPSPACRPTCRGAAAATWPGTSACRRRSSARRVASCRSVPSTPMRSPRSSCCASCPAGLADLLLAEHDLNAARQIGDLVCSCFALASLLIFAQVGLPDQSFTDRGNGPCRRSRRLTMRPAMLHARPLVVRHVGRQGEDLGIGMWPSKRPPHGSRPSASTRRSFSSRLGADVAAGRIGKSSVRLPHRFSSVEGVRQ